VTDKDLETSREGEESANIEDIFFLFNIKILQQITDKYKDDTMRSNMS